MDEPVGAIYKVQHAFDCYVKRFGESDTHVNEDISIIDKATIPDHTLLVGGFPCQDYSVARSLSKEKGIHGKKRSFMVANQRYT